MRMQPPETDRLVQQAAAELSQYRLARAADLLAAALLADPAHPMALTKQAELALLRQDPQRALALTDAALAVEPNFAPAWHQRASACWLLGGKAEALASARRAVDIQPPNPGFRLRLAQFAAWTGHAAETRTALAPLLAGQSHDPVHHAASLSMLGELAIAEGDFEAAQPWLDQALALQPGLHVTRTLRGMNRLRLGQFHAGWADYAARETIRDLDPDGMAMLADPGLAGRIWEGQDLAGKSLLVTDDQGHGDAIQFFRYLTLLRDRGAGPITWRTFPPLVRLFAAAAPDATVLNALPGGAHFDFQCLSTNLPRAFDTDLDSIPAVVPYRAVRYPGAPHGGTPHAAAAVGPPASSRPSQRTKRTRPGQTGSEQTRPEQPRPKQTGPKQTGPEQMGSASTGGEPQVGLAWSGDARHTRDHLRSIPAALFLGLADGKRIGVHSLQHAVCAADRPALQARPAIGRAIELAADFADTAVLIERLDLVITVDTAVAHLAASIGKPVWIVLHVAPDWRWLTDRSDSPWYPSVRLFRVAPAEWPGDADAPEGEDWRPVLQRVDTALRRFAADWPAQARACGPTL
jgi:tetratricopeptide (TPR) repeat protein